MRFEDFARAHGLIINGIQMNRWVATPTEDHPKKRNGRYKLIGEVGWVQNWATMQEPAMWRSEVPFKPTPALIKARKDEAARIEAEARAAASKAGWILHQCVNANHPYLEAKGFPDEIGRVWRTEDGLSLVVPMFRDSRLVGCQLINEKGEKKFLKGQRTKGASFPIDAKGIPIFCEGFATALSIRAVMKLVKIRYTIHVCFSAGNMKDVAQRFAGGFVIADNDSNGVGESAARDTGKPYWLSPTAGDDFNDYHRRVGDFAASQSLKKFVLSNSLASFA